MILTFVIYQQILFLVVLNLTLRSQAEEMIYYINPLCFGGPGCLNFVSLGRNVIEHKVYDV